MNINDNMIMPPSVELVITFGDDALLSIPLFLLLMLAKERDGNVIKDEKYKDIEAFPDDIAANDEPSVQERYISYLELRTPWDRLSIHLSCSPDLLRVLERMWTRRSHVFGPYFLRLRQRKLPAVVYRYTPYNPERIEQLLSDGKLYMPCPAKFNDPFDCSLDDSMRLTFIECAIGCFSAVPDNVLMFSHYADHHRGLCVGFDTKVLVSSMATQNPGSRADIRPVWYFRVMPKLSVTTLRCF